MQHNVKDFMRSWAMPYYLIWSGARNLTLQQIKKRAGSITYKILLDEAAAPLYCYGDFIPLFVLDFVF